MLQIEKIQRLDLGIQGENLSRTIRIDCTAWQTEYENGAISIWHRRNGDSAANPTGASYDPETGIISWSPAEYDTFYPGEGEAQIRITEDNVIKKTIILTTIVRPAIINTAGDIVSSDWQGYINEVERLKNGTVQALLDTLEAKTATEEIIPRIIQAKEDAEAWANATRDGEEIGSEDPIYGISAKDWAEKASESAGEAEESEKAAKASESAAKTSEANAADSESQAEHWAEVALQGAETSGFAWFDIHDGDGCMYVTVSPQLNGHVRFSIDESTGELEVTVIG